MAQVVNSTHAGDGAPVILVHGLAASLVDWTDLIPALASAGYGVYALDLLGHGRSLQPKELDQYHVDRIFEHFYAWVEGLELDQPAIFIGHSLGGYLSIEYALRQPEKVRALVLSDPFYTLDQLPPLLRFHYKHPLINLGWISYAPEWLIRLSLELGGLFIRNGYALPSSREGRAQTARDYKRASTGIFNILSTSHDLTPFLSQVTAPTLVIWGNRDQTLSPKSFPKFAACLPNAQTVAMQAGHVPHQSHAGEFNRHVIEFLKSV